jgi:hypothetical protein
MLSVGERKTCVLIKNNIQGSDCILNRTRLVRVYFSILLLWKFPLVKLMRERKLKQTVVCILFQKWDYNKDDYCIKMVETCTPQFCLFFHPQNPNYTSHIIWHFNTYHRK